MSDEKKIEPNDPRFPRWKFHPAKDQRLVESAAEEKKIGKGWFDSPAEFGVETAPGRDPDETIAGKKTKPDSE